MNFEEIKKALATSKISEVARATGISRQGLYQILKRSKGCSIKTLEILQKYFSKEK